MGFFRTETVEQEAQADADDTATFVDEWLEGLRVMTEEVR